jgi:hypothetical protein
LIAGAAGSFTASAAIARALPTGEWRATADRDLRGVQLEATARDGRTVLQGGCNNLLEPGFIGTIRDYPGDALLRVDEGEEAVSFEISGVGGTSRFQARVSYVAHERAWPLTGMLPPDFFNKIAQGVALTLRNASGKVVATFPLNGTARAVDLVKQVCKPWSVN